MLNANLLVQNNKTKAQGKIKMRRQMRDYFYSSSCGQIDLFEIGRVISFIETVRKQHALHLIPIRINLGNRAFADKLSYILYESLLHYLIEKERCPIETVFNCPHNIFNEGIKHSCLVYSGIDRSGRRLFIEKYPKDTAKTHFRRIVKKEDGDDYLSLVAQDIDSFLKHTGITEECRDYVRKVAEELIDNALDHGDSECLFDMDITKEYFKQDKVVEEESYVGVNIVVMNYSSILLGDLLRGKMESLVLTDNPVYERYQKISEAYEYHSKFLNNDYTEDDFYCIASFQHKISGRMRSVTGGTGLTKLIEALENKSDSYYCYCITGTRMLRFFKDCLNHSADDWVGFNSEDNFLTALPDKKCLGEIPFFFPGTAYNLNFVLKKEDLTDERTEN